jgi:hypothetical protein
LHAEVALLLGFEFTILILDSFDCFQSADPIYTPQRCQYILERWGVQSKVTRGHWQKVEAKMPHAAENSRMSSGK